MRMTIKTIKRICLSGLWGSLFPGIAASVLLAGCSEIELSSRWRDRLVVVDGVNLEWQDAMTYLEDKKVAVGLLNDEEYLYVALVTTDRQLQRQIVGLGFTLWFDPAGGKGKSFGIRFPLGIEDKSIMRSLKTRGSSVEQDMAKLQEELVESMTELEILGPGENESRRLPLSNEEGIFVKIGVSGYGLVYELRIPLAESEIHPLAIGAATGTSIGIGLETPEMKMDMMRGRMGGGMPGMGGGKGGGRGGSRGGRPGGGMRGGSRRPEMSEPFKVWAKVQLVTADVPGVENVDEQATSQ